ncbi:hypothetical protein H5410_064078 [Solanum commersonii]|uniref:Uncharacterized protein n=1 Tax=Solanum commersonii TaxID=4109 RepID=A0A9J5W0A6_SOLCO|nr:hypothetical protein H5410_064078 [Solanum commersonii]
MEPVGPQGQNNPFSGLNNPRKLLPHICKNITWISVKTLPMEPIGLHGQNCPSSRSNDPRSR